jgi:hypothetical protein
MWVLIRQFDNDKDVSKMPSCLIVVCDEKNKPLLFSTQERAETYGDKLTSCTVAINIQ